MFGIGGAMGGIGGALGGIAGSVGGVAGAMAGGAGSAIGSAIQDAMASADTITRQLSAGSKGADVAAVQKKLNMFGAGKLTPDGAFGPKTDAAVRNLQKMFLLKQDGIVGVQTAGALGLPYAGPRHGALAGAAAAAAGGAAAGAAGGGGPDMQSIVMALTQSLGQTLTGLLPGPQINGVIQDMVKSVLPAVQSAAGQLPFSSAGGGMGNPGAIGQATNELAKIRARVGDMGANTPDVGGMFSQAGQMLGGMAGQIGGALGGMAGF